MKKSVSAILVAIFLFSPIFLSNASFSNEEDASLRELKTSAPAPYLSKYWDVTDVDISKLRPEKKHVAFTFDDSPNRTLEQIVGVFTAFNETNPDCVANATVFYNGIRIDSKSLPSVYTAYTVGFETGNHTFSHFNLCALSTEKLQEEIDKTNEILKKIDGKSYHLLRAPYGNVNEQVRNCANAPIIDWWIDTLDWTNNSADEICERVLNGIESGAIVLMHDGPQNTVTALKRLLPELKRLGYQVTSVSQLSKIHTCPLRTGGVYTRARAPKKQ